MSRVVLSFQLALLPAMLVSVALCALAQTQPDPALQDTLKGLSLEQLGNVEVTTVSKSPVSVTRTPAAISLWA